MSWTSKRAVGLAVIVALGAVLASASLGSAGTPKQQTIVYQGSSADILNPERGFAIRREAIPPPMPALDPCGTGNNFTAYTWTGENPPLSLAELTANRAAGRSVIYVRYHIAKYRNAPLSDAFLARLDRDFATVRAAGFKLVPRFAYNLLATGGPDAPLDRVLGHLDQLRPVLHRNADVLAFMELGFIGCWGEMHTSSNHLVDFFAINDATKAIITKAFAAVPSERMIAIRYPIYKFQFFASSNEPIPPLTAAQAFDGSLQARWGEYDDCPVCGEWNGGTWWTPANDVVGVRQFLRVDNRYVVQGGEPGVPPTQPQPTDLDHDGYTSGYDSCVRVLPMLAGEHWSVLYGGWNADSRTEPAKRWEREGCYGTIASHLGYRFRLVSGTFPKLARRGGSLDVTLVLHNDGWAAPYNPRAVELVLRNKKTGAVTRVPVPGDPRRWLPGSTITLPLHAALPASLPMGDYKLFLALPDPAPSLHDRSEYAIRLANENAWDPTCGCNSLQASLRVAGRR